MGLMAKFEELAAQYLRIALGGALDSGAIPESEARVQLESALELLLPIILREADPSYWRLEAFDALRFPVARKTGSFEAEFRGVGLLLSEETWIPIQVRLRAADDRDTIIWASCQAGDRDVGRAQRLPAKSPDIGKLLRSVCEHPEKMNWAFSAEYPGDA